MLTKADEDYLKIIYKLAEEKQSGKGISTSAIAERLKISQASVSNMIKKLAERAWVAYEPYYGVRLTEKGQSIAVNMIRRHRILELYLVERLSYQWDEVDAEAEVLEHAVSDKLIDKMWEDLGRPKQDPHGSPIPDKHGMMQLTDMHSLVTVLEGHTVKVVRFKNKTPEELRYLNSIGLIKDTEVRVAAKNEANDSISVEIGQNRYELGYKLAESIFVTN